MRDEAGFTLIDVVVAIAVLSIGAIASLQAMTQSTRVTGERTSRALALLVAQNRAEELRLVGARAGRGLPMTATMGPVDWTLAHAEEATEVGLVEVTITVGAPDHPGALLVVYVPAGAAP